MERKTVLYVKSEITVSAVKYAHSGYLRLFRPWSMLTEGYGASRATKTTRDHRPDDQEAIDLLKKVGIEYRLVDLSNCSIHEWLWSRMRGIDETPALVLNGKTMSGVENITQALERIRTKRRVKKR